MDIRFAFVLALATLIFSLGGAEVCHESKDFILILDASQAEAPFWSQTRSFASSFISSLAIDEGVHRFASTNQYVTLGLP
jgi:hypothetical protein